MVFTLGVEAMQGYRKALDLLKSLRQDPFSEVDPEMARHTHNVQNVLLTKAENQGSDTNWFIAETPQASGRCRSTGAKAAHLKAI